jgi:hypothetical protein
MGAPPFLQPVVTSAGGDEGAKAVRLRRNLQDQHLGI